MSNETPITVVGRLTGDPELRFTPSGHAVANFTVATNARTFDKASNEWKDQPATFWPCTVWRDLAENAANSLTKGAAVIARGNVETRSWEDKQSGDKRSRVELQVDAIGPDLRWATAAPVKTQRTSQTASQAAPASDDPWQQSTGSGGWGVSNDDSIPF